MEYLFDFSFCSQFSVYFESAKIASFWETYMFFNIYLFLFMELLIDFYAITIQ